MKNLNKILIILTTCCCFITSLTLADNTDCGIFAIDTYKQNSSVNGFTRVDGARETNSNKFTQFLTSDQRFDQQTAIITKNDLNTAILNLKKYCCDNGLGGLSSTSCTKDTPFYNENSLDSAYLFDHLFDVIMRRLNGLSGETNIYTKTEMTLDGSGAARREFMASKALSSDGASPQEIKQKYEQFRTGHSNYYIADKVYNVFWSNGNQDFLNYVNGNGGTEDSKAIAEAMQNYNSWSLYDRYKNACALSEYFYALLDVGGQSNDKSKISSSSCDAIVEQQIRGENKYTTLVTKKASNLFLIKYMKGYMSYLSYRQASLEGLWKTTTDRWLDVIRGVSCLQRKCVK